MKRRQFINAITQVALVSFAGLTVTKQAHAASPPDTKNVTIDWKYGNPEPEFINCQGSLKTGKVTVVIEFHYKKMKNYEQRQDLNIGIVVNSLSEARYDKTEDKEIAISTGGVGQPIGPMLESELAFSKVKLGSKIMLYFGFDNVPKDAKLFAMNVGIAPDTKSWQFMIVRDMPIHWVA